MLSLPPPDAYGIEEALAESAEEAPAADPALEPTCSIASYSEDTAAPDSGDHAPDANVPAEVDTQEPKRRQAFKALEIAAQIHQVQEWLTEGKRPNEIRRLCHDEWGLSTRVSETRMADARHQMVIDVNTYDRKEMAAKMIQSLDTVLNQALEMHQGSNAIGAMRLQAVLLQLLSRQN